METLKEHLLAIGIIVAIISGFAAIFYLISNFEKQFIFAVGGAFVVYGVHSMYSGILAEARRMLKQRKYKKYAKKFDDEILATK